MTNAELADRVFEYRVRHNITQVEFAEMLNLTAQTISTVENGRHVGKKTKARIILFLSKEK